MLELPGCTGTVFRKYLANLPHTKSASFSFIRNTEIPGPARALYMEERGVGALKADWKEFPGGVFVLTWPKENSRMHRQCSRKSGNA